MQSYLGGYMRPRVEALMLAVGFVLLIACANLAGLSLVRIARRNLEVATRMALELRAPGSCGNCGSKVCCWQRLAEPPGLGWHLL